MGKLIYSMITSLYGYAEAAQGDIGAGAEDPQVHTFVGDVFRPVGTYLYGRRMYETMVFWETVHKEPDVPEHVPRFRAGRAAHLRQLPLTSGGVTNPTPGPSCW